MTCPLPDRKSRLHAFTLVEILVAIAILSIMLVGLATAIGYVSRLWLSGIGAMDNFTKARVVLNLLDRDIQLMVLRRDLAAFVDASGNAVDGNGNAICAFYTNVQGNPGSGIRDARTLSLVQYSLTTTTTSPTLQRINYGMNFTASGVTPVMGTPASLPTAASFPVSAPYQSDTVFAGIIRFQIQFIDGNGNILTPTGNPNGSMLAGGRFAYDFNNPGNVLNPRIAVVSMLVLNNSAYTIAIRPGSTTMTTLLGDFQNTLPSGQTNQTFGQYWSSLLNPASGTLDPVLPPSVRSGMQVFERQIPLPVSAPSF